MTITVYPVLGIIAVN